VVIRRRILVCAALMVLATGAAPSAGAQDRFDEQQVKAAFLFKLAQFVEWPAAAFADAQRPIVIGVLGQDPFGKVLDDIVDGEMVAGRPLVVQRFTRVEDVMTCHILFVGASERSSYPRIFSALKGRPILTVGDAAGFAASGGMIAFASEQNHVVLRVNLRAARAAKLTISSNILRASTIVTGGASE
jgi:hypothetical protein